MIVFFLMAIRETIISEIVKYDRKEKEKREISKYLPEEGSWFKAKIKKWKIDYNNHVLLMGPTIKKRVFSYDYENMLYYIFTYKNEKNHLCQHETWDKEYIIQEIAKYENKPLVEARMLFSLFCHNELVDPVLKGFNVDKDYFSTHYLEVIHSDIFEKYRIGYILSDEYDAWKIVSDADMNIGKWILIQNSDIL